MPNSNRKGKESIQKPQFIQRRNVKELLTLKAIPKYQEQQITLTNLEVAGLYDFFMNCGYISHEFDGPVHTSIKKINMIVRKLFGDV